MKNQFLTLVFMFGLLAVNAQTIEGGIKISGLPKDGKIKVNQPVDLYKNFRDGLYKIQFSYQAKDINHRNIVLFEVRTTILKDGQVLSKTSRKNWPFLPGDMYMPIEFFDVIPALQGNVMRMPAPNLDVQSYYLPKGTYEIQLELVAQPTYVDKLKKEVKPSGKIAPVKFSLIVNGLLE